MGLFGFRHIVNVKYTLDFEEIEYRKNLKYLHKFLYYLHIEMIVYIELNEMYLKLILPVSFYLFHESTRKFKYVSHITFLLRNTGFGFSVFLSLRVLKMV